jgi:cation diffusion facilitator CzcD-associated flavoprotein CzcO
MIDKPTRNPSVVIIGAGMTGVLLTIKLREAGITDLTILEKSDRLGGTWRENTYPGVACDIPAHMYTYSFEPNPEWSHRYAHGDEIQEYFERVGRKYGVTNSINFNEAVTSCVYNDGKWTVETSKGRTIVADFIINSTGILHHPAKPDIKGIETFEGPIFHTAEWDHSAELAGKKIGIIGTGSTAAQVVPEVAKVASRLSVFQRSPQWILPLGNKSVTEKEKARLRGNPIRVLRLRQIFRWGLSHLLTKAVTGHKLQKTLLTMVCQQYMKHAVKDPVLREKLTPDFEVGCKRLVITNTFIPALQRDNVDVISDGIAEITPTGIRTRAGKQIDMDVLVLSTGFNPVAYMRPMNLLGRDGLDINDVWKDKIKTYRSICLPGFPNNFLMLGPNSPIGNFSVIEMSEIQTRYIIKIIQRWRQYEFDAIEVKSTAVQRFADYMKKGMSKTAWVGGCQSWYLDGDGEPILWPYTFQRWEAEMAEPTMTDFDMTCFSQKVNVADIELEVSSAA